MQVLQPALLSWERHGPCRAVLLEQNDELYGRALKTDLYNRPDLFIIRFQFLFQLFSLFSFLMINIHHQFEQCVYLPLQHVSALLALRTTKIRPFRTVRCEQREPIMLARFKHGKDSWHPRMNIYVCSLRPCAASGSRTRWLSFKFFRMASVCGDCRVLAAQRCSRPYCRNDTVYLYESINLLNDKNSKVSSFGAATNGSEEINGSCRASSSYKHTNLITFCSFLATLFVTLSLSLAYFLCFTLNLSLVLSVLIEL